MPCHRGDTRETLHQHECSCGMPSFLTANMTCHICHTYKAGYQDVISYVLPVCLHYCKYNTYLSFSDSISLKLGGNLNENTHTFCTCANLMFIQFCTHTLREIASTLPLHHRGRLNPSYYLPDLHACRPHSKVPFLYLRTFCHHTTEKNKCEQ
jgi:hypothetical protein